MISVDEVFAEDFTPAWLATKRRLKDASMLDSIEADTEFNWKQNALAKASLIAERWPPKKPPQNA